MIKWIREFMYSNERTLEERRFLLAGIVACVAVVAVLLSVITTDQSMAFAVVLLITLAILITVIVYTLRSKHFMLGSSIIILFSNLVVLPMGYLMGGGANSGAPIWFVVGGVFVFVLFRGKLFWIYLIMTAIAAFSAVVAGARHPEWVTPLQDGYSIHIDVYVAAACVAFLCGVLFKFQSRVLERELKRAEEQTVEIEHLNEQQNTFFSSMSHEIRTPISTIIGLNEMTMREKQLPAEVMENTLNIQNASKLLLSLINDLLDMSKIQSGKMEIVPAEYDTSRMLSEITNLHWNRAMEKDLRFDIQVGKDIPPMLYGDETRVKQVIINLLANAIKYTNEGSVTLRFGGEKESDETFMLQVEIEDTGIGIRKENLKRLFEPFRRVEGDDTRHIEGTGLGLSISKQLVDLMGGKIIVNSIYTKGSTFRVDIPQGIVSTDAATMKAPGIIQNQQPTYQQAFEAPRARVLIVDDNDMNRIVCRKLLRATRVQVDLVDSGEECLEKTRENHYDTIFMDHEMPQMDGIETLHRLRQQTDGLCRETPVIALTANAGSDRAAFYAEQGFSAYLSKPIQSSRLEALLLASLPPDLVEQSFVETEAESLQISEAIHKRPYIITTDSICDLPEDIVRESEILVMPYYIQTEEGRFRDREEIDSDNLQQLLATSDETVVSAPAPVQEYEEFFGNALTEARAVLHLSACKKNSDAYAHAKRAAESFGEVQVIDAGQISIGLGMMALRAVTLFRGGKTQEEVVAELEGYRKRVGMRYLLPTFDAMKSRYRAGILAATLIRVFNLEPVFAVRREQLVIHSFVMGYMRSTTDQFIRQTLHNRRGLKTDRLFVIFSGCPIELREHVLEEIAKYVQFREVIVNKASATSFINCGPLAIGLGYERDD